MRKHTTQKGIHAKYNHIDMCEEVTCPFCGVVCTAEYVNNYYLTDMITCDQLRGFVSGGGSSVVANFEGFADQLN